MRLARLTGVRTLDAFFEVKLTQILVPAELERDRIRRHVFLARYGRQSMLQWDDVDGRVVRRYARALEAFLNEENALVEAARAKAASEAGTSG